MYRLEDWPDLLSLRVCVLPLNSAKPTDYWIGLQARARGFTRSPIGTPVATPVGSPVIPGD